ncbi:MAG: HD domain-containing protein [Patescibacteria group bacterium]
MIEKAKKLFFKTIKADIDIYGLLEHVPEAEKWAKKMCGTYPDADREVVLLSVWLHDIAYYPVDEIDHAVKSEKMAREFLKKENYPKDKMGKVLHCVRSHRDRDIKPETLEAKIMACVDSASHMTDSMYANIIRDGHADYVFGKLERDYRDISKFPEVQKELQDVYEKWKALLNALAKIDQ